MIIYVEHEKGNNLKTWVLGISSKQKQNGGLHGQ